MPDESSFAKPSVPGDVITFTQDGNLYVSGESIAWLSRSETALLISVIDDVALVLVRGLLGKVDVYRFHSVSSI